MRTVREWSTVICLAAVVCTMLELICPKGNMEKIVKSVFSVFMLCAIISPLTGTISKISFNIKNHPDFKNDSTFQKKISDQTLDICEANIRILIKNELDKYNVCAKKIDVLMDTDDVGSISMIKVKVHLESPPNQDVKKILEDKLDIETEIIYGSE